MPQIRADLVGVVYVRTGTTEHVVLAAGEDVPEGATVGDHLIEPGTAGEDVPEGATVGDHLIEPGTAGEDVPKAPARK